MNPLRELDLLMTRRQLFGRASLGLGTAALASLLPTSGFSLNAQDVPKLNFPNFPAKAKRVIFLCMNGGPSQHDMWDYKPKMSEKFNADIPAEIQMGQRLTTMTSGQERFPIAPSRYKFNPYDNGNEEVWVE